MENVWYTYNGLATIPTEEHYDVIGDFNCALFIERLISHHSVN